MPFSPCSCYRMPTTGLAMWIKISSFLRNKNSIYDFTMLIMICTTIITINTSVVLNLPLHENVSKSRVLVFLGTKPRNEIYLFVRQTPTILSLGVANNYLLHRVSFSPSRCACFSTQPCFCDYLLYIRSWQRVGKKQALPDLKFHILSSCLVAVFLRNWKP